MKVNPSCFTEIPKSYGEFKWKLACENLTKNPGCKCRGNRKTSNCKLGICSVGWGVQNIEVFCGFVYNFYSEIMEAVKIRNSRARLARITYKSSDGNVHHDIGLLVEHSVAKEVSHLLDLKVCEEQAKKRGID